MDESKIIQMNMTLRDRGESILSNNFASFYQNQNQMMKAGGLPTKSPVYNVPARKDFTEMFDAKLMEINNEPNENSLRMPNR